MAVQKIIFPYLLDHSSDARTAVFFGTDFYNLPIGSDQAVVVERTNAMLAYIRKNLPNHRLLYQPHPNETDEYSKLDLAGNGFGVGKRTIADFLLYHGARDIDWVFASCSWSAATAYAMGYHAAVFLDLLHGAVPDETIVGYRSYFHGLPKAFFISSFDAPLPNSRRTDIEEEKRTMQELVASLGTPKTFWSIASDPAYIMRNAIVARHARAAHGQKTGLLMIEHNRWELIKDDPILDAFDVKITVPRVWYTARPLRVLKVFLAALKLSKLPLKQGDTVVSFAHAQFAENCVLSWYKVKKILMTENRWYYFTYESEGGGLPKEDFHGSFGLSVFNAFVEPLLRLFKSEYLEYKDGKVVNIVRYKKSLEAVYDAVFVLIPPK